MSHQEIDKMPVNPQMIVLARESRGLTQQEFARISGLPQTRVSRIERGEILVDQTELNIISETLAYVPDFFRNNNPIYGPSIGEFFHRKKSKVPKKPLSKTYAGIEIRRIQIKQLLQNVDIGEVNFFRMTPTKENGGVEGVAQAVRATWNIPIGPINNVVNIIEEAGGIVIPFDFGSAQIDAISIWVEDMPPLFFINILRPWDRIRFTLCHEIGHMIMHKIPRENVDIEEEADKFASEFLMPKKLISTTLDSLTLRKTASLKLYWRVSMQAVVKRAESLNRISKRQSQYLWTQIGKMGYRTIEPPELSAPVEEPQLLNRLIEFHQSELRRKNSELAAITGVSENEFRSVFLPKSHLRII